jgi:polysaccharide biosynthesis/export protein
MTIQDLVLIAGGFTEGAAESMAEVARRVRGGIGRDTLATVHRVPLDFHGNGKGSGLTAFALQQGDQVFIRRLPNYQVLETVDVTGEVLYPGPYTVSARRERVSDLVARAGGLTSEAYAPGLRLFRDGKPIGVNFQKALKDPGGVDDIAIEAGDRLEVPRFDPTVLVTGAVTFESRVPYQKGLSLDDYLVRAGGVTDEGNASKASVRYPNGAVRSKTRIMGILRVPEIQPGSTITVPEKTPNSGFSWDNFLTKTLAVMSTLATLIVAYSAVN